MATPSTYVLSIYRGDTYGWQFVLWNDADKTDPLDLADVTPKAEIRAKTGGELLTTLACEVILPNTVEATLTAAISRTLPVGTAAWDLQLTTAAGGVSTVLAGPVVVTADVTDSVA